MVRFFIFLLLAIVLASCGQNTPELTATEILQHSAERMLTLKGFHVAINLTGAPAFLDISQTLSLNHLEGGYVAPDKLQADVRVITPGAVVSVKVISIGTEQWQTNLFTGQWDRLKEGWGFDPIGLLDAETGLPSILASDLSDLLLTKDVELEEMPGKKLYLITGKLSGQRLSELSGGMITQDSLDAQIWIDPETFDLERAILIEYSGQTEKERVWQIDLWDFDQVDDIQPPA